MRFVTGGVGHVFPCQSATVILMRTHLHTPFILQYSAVHSPSAQGQCVLASARAFTQRNEVWRDSKSGGRKCRFHKDPWGLAENRGKSGASKYLSLFRCGLWILPIAYPCYKANCRGTSILVWCSKLGLALLGCQVAPDSWHSAGEPGQVSSGVMV